MNFIAPNIEKCRFKEQTTSKMNKIVHISFCDFTPIGISQILLLLLQFPNVLLTVKMLHVASELNLAANFRLRFCNFDFSAILVYFYPICPAQYAKVVLKLH